ncbi:MAG: DNA repair protein RecN [Desulfobacterales bacterium]|nr:DNA repair protein RecN [Desulfobacterales bacterium]
MLSELAIKKFAIIEDIRISFKQGLSMLTGETGAGKSILIQAVNLLLGARASSDLVRTGEDHAELEACFDIEPGSETAQAMADQGMDPEDGLLIRRVVSRSGKSKVYINSRQSTLDYLRLVTRNLAGVVSQHAQQGLLNEDYHLDILDEYAGTGELREKVSLIHNTLVPLKSKIKKLKDQRERRLKEKELIEFQVDEIQSADIQPDEDLILEKKRERLKNAAQIFETVNGAVHELYDREGSLVEHLSSLDQNIEKYSDGDADLTQVGERIKSILFDLQDVTELLRGYGDGIDLDPHSLEEVDQRLDLISRLKRKYGGSLDSLFGEYERLESALNRTENMDKEIADLEAQQETLIAEIRKKAAALSLRRQNAGISLGKRAKDELSALEMGRARFQVAVSTLPAQGDDLATEDGEKIWHTGMDRVCFMLSPNPGEAAKPLAKIASGGELSRIVLALKAVLSGNQSLETLIFDEVDAGIGGAVSEKVGLKLKALGDKHQVICITHLAQIAKYGRHQYRISKAVVNDRTATSIVPLESQEERVDEIARMIGGSKITETTRSHAREMLAKAEA